MGAGLKELWDLVAVGLLAAILIFGGLVLQILSMFGYL